jgi:hypothetical protein
MKKALMLNKKEKKTNTVIAKKIEVFLFDLLPIINARK